MSDPTLIITPVLNALVPLVEVAVGTVATWAIGVISHKIAKLLKLKSDDAVRAYLDDGWSRAFAFAKSALEKYAAERGALPMPVGTSFLERKAAEYMVAHFADGLNHFGVTPEHVASVAQARLNALVPAPQLQGPQVSAPTP